MTSSSSIQAFVKVVPNGGTKSDSALSTQSSYSSNYAEASEMNANLEDINELLGDNANTCDAEDNAPDSAYVNRNSTANDSAQGAQDAVRVQLANAIDGLAAAQGDSRSAPSPHMTKVYLQRSERYFGINIEKDELSDFCKEWTEQTGVFTKGQKSLSSDPDLTTHIVISFPEHIEADSAHAAARDWAAEMFDSGKYGGKWDYITAFHTNRPHPHLHVIVNRRELENGDWLKISKRNEHINYDSMRDVLVEVAAKHGIELEATSRAERGLEGTTVSLTKHHMEARGAILSAADRSAEKRSAVEGWRLEAANASTPDNVDAPNSPANLPTENGDEDIEAAAGEDTANNVTNVSADDGDDAAPATTPEQAPTRRRRREPPPERSMVLRSDAAKRREEEAGMELRSGRRVGEPPARSDEDAQRGDRIERRRNNQRGE
ncbi:MAG: relaxase/mobilization nuclease domain-containing protein [Pseudomonadota bacterium]